MCKIKSELDSEAWYCHIRLHILGTVIHFSNSQAGSLFVLKTLGRCTLWCVLHSVLGILQ